MFRFQERWWVCSPSQRHSSEFVLEYFPDLSRLEPLRQAGGICQKPGVLSAPWEGSASQVPGNVWGMALPQSQSLIYLRLLPPQEHSRCKVEPREFLRVGWAVSSGASYLLPSFRLLLLEEACTSQGKWLLQYVGRWMTQHRYPGSCPRMYSPQLLPHQSPQVTPFCTVLLLQKRRVSGREWKSFVPALS